MNDPPLHERISPSGIIDPDLWWETLIESGCYDQDGQVAMIEIHEVQGHRKGERFRGRTLVTAARTRYGAQARAFVGSQVGVGVREVTVCTPLVNRCVTPPRSDGWAVRAVWIVTDTE